MSVSPTDRLITLPGGELPTLTLGYEAIDWAEAALIQPNGPRAGEPFRFTPSQGRFLLHWYAVNPDGSWVYHHSARRWAKGAGKSPLAAVFGLVEFCAPVRVADIDLSRPEGLQVIGRPVDLPLVQIAATSEQQTANTMRMIRAFAPKGSRVVKENGLDCGIVKYYKASGGELQVITASATTAEGAECTAVIADETEHWTPSNGGVDLAAVLDRNLAKSGSRMMETSNAWVPGSGSVAETTWDAWVAQEEGKTRGTSKILYDASIAPPGTDLADGDSLMAGLRSAYRDCFWVDLEVLRERVWDLRTPPDVARRFYLNQPTAAEDAWTTPAAWGALSDATKTVGDGEEVVLFFDGSLSQDATALIGCRVDDGHIFTVGIWEPDGDRVPTDQVDQAVEFAFTTWTVVAAFCDVREWEGFTKITWPERYQDELEVWAEPMSRADPQPMAWDMRGKTREFTRAAELTATEIESGEFTHDGDSRLARHVVNARRRMNRYGVSIGKESKASQKKIDAAVCVIGARMVRRAVLTSRAQGNKAKRPRTGAAVFF